MKNICSVSIIVITLFLSSDIYSQSLDTIKQVAPGATLQKVSDQFSFTEGPAVNKKGVIYFTDQPNNRIWKYDTDGRLSIYMENCGRSNGLYFDKKGNLVACADEKNELWSIDPNNGKTVILSDVNGHKLNGPNDLWIDPKGGIYFTDPYYQRNYWERKKPEIEGEKVYYLPKGAKQPIAVEEKVLKPNGIVGSADGKFLYVADLRDNKTYKYRINKDGSLTDRQLFVPQGSDGMTFDEKGNLYITGKGVTIYDPNGKRIANIPVPSGWVGNVCFGGKDRKTLFITASESVYVLKMSVKGVE